MTEQDAFESLADKLNGLKLSDDESMIMQAMIDRAGGGPDDEVSGYMRIQRPRILESSQLLRIYRGWADDNGVPSVTNPNI